MRGWVVCRRRRMEDWEGPGLRLDPCVDGSWKGAAAVSRARRAAKGLEVVALPGVGARFSRWAAAVVLRGRAV